KEDKGSGNRSKHEQPYGNFCPAHARPTFPHGLEFARWRRITELIVVEVYDRDVHAMLHFAFPQIVEMAVPAWMRGKILSYMFRDEDVSCVAAIHYPLGDVNSGPRNICSLVHIPDLAHRPAVNPHPQLNLRMSFDCLADFNCTSQRRLDSVAKNQRHAVPCWNPNQHAVRVR